MSEPASPTPWLSVVMPSYAGERWIDATLSSLAREADPGIEVILVDSSPTDATRTHAARFADRLALRIVTHATGSGWITKTNRGVALARASHICWLHQDDLWLPGRAAAVRRWVTETPEAALHLAPSVIVDGAGARHGVWRCPFASEGAIDPQRLLERLLVQNFVSTPAPVFRKDAWVATGGLDTTLWYTADWDAWLKLAGQGAVHYHPDPTTAFRVHAHSLTVTGSRDAEDFTAQMQIVLDRHLPRLTRNAGAVRRASRASIAVNRALAGAMDGRPGEMVSAFLTVLALGPLGIRRYLRDSRILDRVLPRVRAKLAGGF